MATPENELWRYAVDAASSMDYDECVRLYRLEKMIPEMVAAHEMCPPYTSLPELPIVEHLMTIELSKLDERDKLDTLGNSLYRQVRIHHHLLAGKITSELLKMDTSIIVSLLCDGDALMENIDNIVKSYRKKEEYKCPICLDCIGDTNICVTVCGHKFCISCLFTHGTSSTDCPLCRTQFLAPQSQESSPPIESQIYPPITLDTETYQSGVIDNALADYEDDESVDTFISYDDENNENNNNHNDAVISSLDANIIHEEEGDVNMNMNHYDEINHRNKTTMNIASMEYEPVPNSQNRDFNRSFNTTNIIRRQIYSHYS